MKKNENDRRADEAGPINFGTPENRAAYERLTPEQQAAVARIRARNRTPEKRAEHERVRELVEQEIPPATPVDRVRAFVALLRAERERQGLTLDQAAVRSGLRGEVLERIERGAVAGPSLAVLLAYADALGLEITAVAAQ